MRTWIPHIAALLVILACGRLALWQLERAAEKTELITQSESAERVDLNRWLDHHALEALPPYAEVSLNGHFDQQRHLMLDNQIRHHHPGVHVWVPFTLSDHALTLLVNRGWQPWARRAGQWPEYETPGGTIALQGRLSDPPKPGLQLGTQEPLDGINWPVLLTYLELDLIADGLSVPLSPQVLWLEADSPWHLTGDPWQHVVMGPERHTAYAFQWLAIGSAVAIIWLVLTLRSRRYP
jgi:surfeit locus 1 family protein